MPPPPPPPDNSYGFSALKKRKNTTFGVFTVDCYYIDFDGKQWGPCQHSFQIEPFEGWKEATSLSIFPVELARNYQEILNHAGDRGNALIAATKVRHMSYKGRTLIDSPSDHPIPGISHAEDVDSEVIVDFDRTIQFNPEWKPDLGWCETHKSEAYETLEMTMPENVKCGINGACMTMFCCMNENILSDMQWDQQRANDFLEERERMKAERGLTENEHLPEETVLLPNRVFAFVLRSRKWGNLRVDGLSSVKEDPTSFDRLEIHPGHKRVIRGLVQTHYRSKDATTETGLEESGFDIVRAKGKGLILLLHGAPGVGKTSTAECIASLHARPLFPITCGDLGMTPAEVEQNLEFNFQLAESWGCVLLLDEADVFLAERTKTDVKRNALVSVFLRALEYYRGILFLTTNRVGTMDEAFRSRIHISLLYEPLSWDQTRAIWTDHLNRLIKEKRVETNVDDILRYAQTLFHDQKREHDIAWNGRQIRNAFQTAVALAEYDHIARFPDKVAVGKASLTEAQFRIVADASVQFDDYMKKTLDNKTAPQYALAEQWRDDTYKGAASFVPPSQPQVPGPMPGHSGQPTYTQYQPLNPMMYTQGFPNAANAFGSYGPPGMAAMNPAMGMHPQTGMAFTQAHSMQGAQSVPVQHGMSGVPGSSQMQSPPASQAQMMSGNPLMSMPGSGVSNAQQPTMQLNGMGQPQYQYMGPQLGVGMPQVQKPTGDGNVPT
ncbi:P-loop containing nucleoside triphosphate hydrolase protein [Lentithecium fluviatile CBS 122367]|uniref:P-loop containing nucleoside triphosphate hydrolase protein n=1 Tax=Lentithecium fluviatile CBS 122367 TaxID=1168545 RepID=A0A6G1IWM1_9PLEO|nr:P-loop containing nucleoside triphosphate hydrolase protein [Lentithecium fluviatile CBS 122367]